MSVDQGTSLYTGSYIHAAYCCMQLADTEADRGLCVESEIYSQVHVNLLVG